MTDQVEEKCRKRNTNKEEEDLKDFMEEIEQDKDIRENIILYRDEENIKTLD